MCWLSNRIFEPHKKEQSPAGIDEANIVTAEG